MPTGECSQNRSYRIHHHSFYSGAEREEERGRGRGREGEGEGEGEEGERGREGEDHIIQGFIEDFLVGGEEVCGALPQCHA